MVFVSRLALAASVENMLDNARPSMETITATGIFATYAETRWLINFCSRFVRPNEPESSFNGTTSVG